MWVPQLARDELTTIEKRLFPELGPANREYLAIRNRIVDLWTANPHVLLEVAVLLSTAKEEERSYLIKAFYFLHRYRFINTGVFFNPIKKTQGIAKIIVVGAGMAGLCCAREIKNQFAFYGKIPEIVVLEGRQRHGGRVSTFRGVDLGAMVVTGFIGNPLDILVRKQLQLTPLYLTNAQGTPLYDPMGKAVPQKTDLYCEQLFNECLEQATRFYVKQGKVNAVPDGKHPRDFLQKKECEEKEQLSLRDAFVLAYNERQKERSPKSQRNALMHEWLINWHIANLEFANAAKIQDISLHHWDQDDEYETDGPHAIIKGGYGQVPDGIAKGTSVSDELQIHYGKEVKQVISFTRNKQRKVSLSCADGTQYECDAVVLTLPLGVLKRNDLSFVPALPKWKTAAIDRMGFGLLNKVALVFPEVFWDTKEEVFGLVNIEPLFESNGHSDLKGDAFLVWDVTKSSGRPTLVAFYSGEAAWLVEKEPADKAVSRLMTRLMARFGASIPQPIEAVVTHWGKDSFARGSYSFVAQGATGDDYDLLAAPIDDRIFWAGEATCRQFPATVHGAMMSGMRASAQVAQVFLGSIKDEIDYFEETVKRSA